MERPRIPLDEAQRLAALHATRLLGSAREETFDRITRTAARLLGVPIALVSLIDKDRQWFKSRTGLDACETPREISFCGHAILSDEPLVVPDAAQDARFVDNPLVTGDMHLRFYAGVQLYSVDRKKIGTLCVIDSRPRQLGPGELDALRDLARMVEQLVYHRQLAMAAQSLSERLQDCAPAPGGSPASGELAWLVAHDLLTGLPNRQAMLRAIQGSIAGWRADGTPALVACINVDHFKRFNETLGHRAGDEILVGLATSLQALLREGDMLARAGSDEFLLLLHARGEHPEPERAFDRIMAAANRAIPTPDGEIALTCSIGTTLLPQDGDDADALLNNAVTAMRHAKAQGRGEIVRFTPELRTEHGRRLTLESHLRRAIAQDELFLQYQPKVDLRSGGLAGFEALVRWRHPEYGVIPPDEFIPIAEESGMIVPIGEWVLRSAVGQLAAWRAQGLPLAPVAVNLSARQFLQSDVIATVGELLEQSGLAPGLLELELTESVSMADPERSVVVMRGLGDLGVMLSIDDFGTGYSSFGYLRRLPLDKLKIDKSFVQDMAHSAESSAIVQAIVAMAHRLQLAVIAEGVETADQVAALRKADCDQIQGYYYSRPLAVEDCAPFIRQYAAAPAGGSSVSAKA
ncbi:bifunctional diguanylate cyclase/phosphodiesterase [Massilia sp. LC238]|uniref:putative bifunctional diguanylate cyclase/phosphodiesterase n=1 Tax=Massilia sp. LC238 TaxID=1502852 RepID=UPI0004E41790|nr:EAL domain-containing protein [Massilia sp. LC238]KFC74480.1 Diguanylate cyclase/phosphodiesterase with PAS/PAC sensor domains protein [Massilia sp. LC238]